MKVKPIETESAAIEDEVVKEVVLPESIRVGGVLRIAIVLLDKLVDEVKSRYAGYQEES